MPRLVLLAAALLTAATTGAEAHTGVGTASSVAHGFAHPLGGVDHLVTMIAVGLFAMRLGGPALWLVPASFVTVMAAGGAAGMAGLGLPLAEAGIAFSIVALGAMIAFRVPVSTGAAMLLVGLFAVFHGHAHGAEMPHSLSALGYGIGFVAATCALHALGIGLGVAAARKGEAFGSRALRTAGSGVALAGVTLLVAGLY
jgi:urease accessory protein